MADHRSSERHYKVLLVSTHVVQYASVIYRELARHPSFEIQVAYCSLQGAEAGFDKEFGREVKWDVPLLDGYPWVQLKNRSWRPGLGRFWGLINPELWKLIREGNYDAVVVYTGYRYASFWIALAAAKWHGSKLLFGTDAHRLGPRDQRRWKLRVKRWLWPALFRLADVVIVPSNAGARLMRSLVSSSRVVIAPYVVDNDWWLARAPEVDRPAVRAFWGIPAEAPVALFCAKLQPWKRPQDVLAAFARANVPGAYLVYAGDGPLRASLEAAAAELGIGERVRFLGFVNQSQLPAVYCASDLLVLSSDYEAFGVVVNEAMLCGCIAAVSDRVGAVGDLICDRQTGFVFPCGDVEALTGILRQALEEPARLDPMREAARRRVETWSPRENVAALFDAIQGAASRG